MELLRLGRWVHAELFPECGPAPLVGEQRQAPLALVTVGRHRDAVRALAGRLLCDHALGVSDRLIQRAGGRTRFGGVEQCAE